MDWKPKTKKMDKNKENPIDDNKEKGDDSYTWIAYASIGRTQSSEDKSSMGTHELMEASSQIWTVASIAQ